ncbi:hypothetical protein V2O64_16165 [Verrucomicrobiaceae bacterium 227]
MKLFVVTTLAMATLGYFSGSIGKQFTRSATSAGDQETASSFSNRDQASYDIVPSGIKSSDTIASLAEIPAPQLYDRLALWLLDASASEMQEFWTTYTARTDRTNDLNDLVFINWTRVDPEAAIAAAEGTEFDKYPWWAWACHEPEKALSEVLARYPGQEYQKQIGNVMWGLGEFHPAWLREHIDELPEKWMRDRALSGYVKFADTDNPLESIEFLKKHGRNIPRDTLVALGREDPLAAYQLALELKASESNYRYRELPDQLIDSLASENPALLDQLLPQITSPSGKMKIQFKQFESLLKLDPAAAEEQAKQLPKGWAREDQLAALAKHHLKENPEKAIEITALLLKDGGSQNPRYSQIYTENGSSTGSGMGESPANGLINQLSLTHPEALIDKVIASEGSYYGVASAWAGQDLPAYAAWVNQQDDPKIFTTSAIIVSSTLTDKGHYVEAMDWVGSLDQDPQQPYLISDRIANTYRPWLRSNPEEARTWKENATLDEKTVEQLNKLEPQNQ